jgi:hypothetical protein
MRGIALRFALIPILLLLLAACSDDQTVPDVIGMTADEAQESLDEAGYDVQVAEDYDEDAQIGTVIGQRPRAGAEHDPERPVQITVAREFLSPPIEGFFTLNGGSRGVTNLGSGRCEGDGGYSDIHSRTQVVVRDESGTILATTNLGDGELVDSGTCEFEFDLPALPRANFYAFEIARRGELTYSFSEMEDYGWIFGASLGR